MRSSSHGLAVLLLLASPLAAQEVDRVGKDLERREPDPRHSEPDTRQGVAPVGSPGSTTGPQVIPADLDLDSHGFPKKDPDPRPEEPTRSDDAVELKFGGKMWTALGHDTNVFRSDRNRHRDGFGQAHGEVEALARFRGGTELFVELSGETLLYFERTRANEHFLSAFVEYFQPVAEWLEVGAQNAFEFSRLNLLDDNGDLFPRGRFGSMDEEVRAFAILRPPGGEEEKKQIFNWRDLALELGASLRLKDYDENRGVDSLDYQEVRLDGSISYKLSRRPRSRLKLKYRFRRRDYDEFRARERAGGVGVFPPHLDLHRHQVNLTWFQEIRKGWFKGKLTIGLGAVYNRDLHENDRSYREASASLRSEWWVVEDRTRINLSLRAVGRNFLVRQPTGQGGHLRHRLLRIRVGVWQRLWQMTEEKKERKPASRTLMTLAVFSNASVTVWRSGDPLEDYDRYQVLGGIELSW